MRLLTIILLLLSFSGMAQTYPDGSTVGNQLVIRVPRSSSSNTPPTPQTTQGLLYLPPDYFKAGNENKKYPLIIFSHGAGQADNTTRDISKLLTQSLPKAIANGFKPYALDGADTIWFIVFSPQVQESSGGSYSYTHFRYMLPNLLKRWRIDQSLVCQIGLSAGGGGGISILREDTTFSRRFAGIQILAGVNYNNGNLTNFNHAITNGIGVLHSWGNIDGSSKTISEGYAAQIEAVPPPANRYYKVIQPGVAHTSQAWDGPVTRDSLWYGGLCVWDRFLTFRRTFKHNYVFSGFQDTIQLPTNSVSLQAEEYPKAGVTVTSRTWTRVAGATSMSISGGSTLTPTFNNLTTGYYRVRMTTTFSDATTAQDETEIWVLAAAPGNVLPTSNAGPDQTLTLPANVISLNGSASSDPDGSISSYAWTKVSGPSGTFSSQSIANPTFTASTSGTYVFQLVVTDNNGATGTDQVTVTINAEPAPDPYEVQQVICSEYKVAFLKSDGTVWGPYWVPGTGTKSIEYAGGHTFVYGDGGLYNMLFLKSNGDVYKSQNRDNILEFLQYDTTGAVFKAIDVEEYFRTDIAVRDDGKICARSYNSYRWFGSNTNYILTKWMQIPGQPDVNFVKVRKGGETGSGMLYGITDDGDVWGVPDNSTTWTQKTFPVPIDRIEAGQYGFYVAIGTDSLPYGWGSRKYLGVPGTGNIDTYEPLATYWNMGTKKIRSIAINDNTIHIVLNDYTMWGLGDNAMGVVGIGSELVNRKELYAGPWYAHNWLKVTDATYQNIAYVGTMQHITPGRLYDKVFSGNYYTQYKYAQEYGTGNLYGWGRNKAAVLRNGRGASNESTLPNTMDVLTPTLMDVFNSVTPSPSTFVPGTVNAGANQSISTTSTTLNGVSTAGKTNSWSYVIASRQWTKLSGPSCTIVSPNTDTTEITGMSNGTYSFQLKITDDNTATYTDTVNVTVSGAGNILPVVNAGSNQTTSASSVTMSGSAADADGSISFYIWRQISGPNTAVIVDADNPATAITGLIQGVYEFELEAVDNNGASGTDRVTVTVTPVNVNPIVTVSNDTSTWSFVVTVTGSADDEDGSITAYQWAKIRGPEGDTIVEQSSPETEITFTTPGVYTYRLTAYDNNGGNGFADVRIVIMDRKKLPRRLTGATRFIKNN